MRSAFPLALTAIRGTFFDFIDDPWNYVGEEHRAGRFVRDGLLVTDDGLIVAFGDYDDVSGDYPNIEVTHIPGRLITPGFIDGHIHFPQTRILGAYGHQLLPWLLESVFPEEMKYGDREYAEEGASSVLRHPARVGYDDLSGVHEQLPGDHRGLLRRSREAEHARDRRSDRYRQIRSR